MTRRTRKHKQRGGAYEFPDVITDANIHQLVRDYFEKFSKREKETNYISKWDVSHVTNMDGLFARMYNFNSNINDWDVSNVVSMNEMFFHAKKFNQPLDKWKTGNVKNMSYMFSNAVIFNRNINDWDVSNVKTMEGMFANAISFNQPLDKWKTGNVKNMEFMFDGAKKFDQPIGSWNMLNVKYITSMFKNAEDFNQPIGEWKFEKLECTASMFDEAYKFNQPIGAWNMSKVVLTISMFKNAIKFNQPIGNWNLSSLKYMDKMFYRAIDFDQDLNKWGDTLNPSQIISSKDVFKDSRVLFSRHIPWWYPIIKLPIPKKINYEEIKVPTGEEFFDVLYGDDASLCKVIMEKDSDGNYENWVFVHRHMNKEENKWESKYFSTPNYGAEHFLNVLRGTRATKTNLRNIGLTTQNSFETDYLKQFFAKHLNEPKTPKLFLIEDDYNIIIPLEPDKFCKNVKRSHTKRKHTISHSFVPYKKQLTTQLSLLQREPVATGRESMNNAHNIHATRAQLAHVSNLHNEMLTLNHSVTKPPRKTMRVRSYSPKSKTRSRTRSKHTKSLG